MRPMRLVCASVVAGGLVLGPSTAFAQDNAQSIQQQIDQLRREFDALKQQYDQRLSALEARLAGGEPPPTTATQPPSPPPGGAQPTAPAGAQPTAQVPPGAEGAGGPTGALPVYGAAAASKIFNPDMAVIGDFLGAAGTNRVQPDPFGPGDHPNALSLHESEAAFQAVVDPYARADFFISFGEEGVGVEEGFITLTSLPGGLLTKV